MTVGGKARPIAQVYVNYGTGALLSDPDKFKKDHKRPAGKQGGAWSNSKLATFLVNKDKAAALDLQVTAYNAANGTTKMDVGVSMIARPGEDYSRLVFIFPYFQTLYYDPSVAVTAAADAGYTSSDTAAADQEPAKNAAFGLKGMGLMQMVVLGLAATLLL